MILLKDSSVSDIDQTIQEINHYEDLLRSGDLSRKDREEVKDLLKSLKKSVAGFISEPEQFPKKDNDVSRASTELLKDPFRFVVYRADPRGKETYLAGSGKYTNDIKSAKLFTVQEADTISRRMAKNSINGFVWKYKEIKKR